MLSKLTIALATTAVLGAAALAPSTAEAHWLGDKYGWHGYGHGPGYYGYKSYGYGYPRYFNRWHYGWKRYGY